MSLVITGDARNVTAPLSATVTALANNGSGAIRVTTSAPHLFGNADLVYMQASPALGDFFITVIDGTHFDLVGSTYASTGTGTATDLSLTPEIQVPTDGDTFSLQLSGMLSSLQALADRTQYLQESSSLYRLYNVYRASGITDEVSATPWSQTVIGSATTWTACTSAGTLLAASQPLPVLVTGDILDIRFETTFGAGGTLTATYPSIAFALALVDTTASSTTRSPNSTKGVFNGATSDAYILPLSLGVNVPPVDAGLVGNKHAWDIAVQCWAQNNTSTLGLYGSYNLSVMHYRKRGS